MPVSAGMLSKKPSSASRPPAEAPMPTMGNPRGRGSAGWSDACSGPAGACSSPSPPEDASSPPDGAPSPPDGAVASPAGGGSPGEASWLSPPLGFSTSWPVAAGWRDDGLPADVSVSPFSAVSFFPGWFWLAMARSAPVSGAGNTGGASYQLRAKIPGHAVRRPPSRNYHARLGARSIRAAGSVSENQSFDGRACRRLSAKAFSDERVSERAGGHRTSAAQRGRGIEDGFAFPVLCKARCGGGLPPGDCPPVKARKNLG